ncbi:MAG: pitrilysin family protein [Nanoarchaeota archaeon]
MNLKRRRLSNGITVLMEERLLPIVSLSISNQFGAVYESSDIKGIAHFIEHLVFTGTKTRTHEDISREIESKGGVLNAFTSHDVTSFWFKLPSKNLFDGLEILSDILNNPIFEKKKFEKEKKVIMEEIKMYHDNPQRHVLDKIEENLYSSPFGEGVIGSEKTISALSRDFVYDYFKKVYNPENFIATIVGSADFNKVCAFLEEKFKKSKSDLKVPKISVLNKETTEERSGIDQAHFVFAFHAPSFSQKEHSALEVLDCYLANGMSSKLFLKIREDLGLAYTVRGSISTEKNYSYYSIYVGTTKQAIPQVKKIIVEEFGNIKDLTEKELKQSKERLIGLKSVMSEESTNTMNDLLFYELATKAEDYYTYDDKINKVSLNDVKAIAKLKSFSTASIVPK